MCLEMGIGSNAKKLNDIQLFKNDCKFDIGIIDGNSTVIEFAFISEKFKGPFNMLPPAIIKGLLSIVNLFPASDKNISLDFKIKQFLP